MIPSNETEKGVTHAETIKNARVQQRTLARGAGCNPHRRFEVDMNAKLALL